MNVIGYWRVTPMHRSIPHLYNFVTKLFLVVRGDEPSLKECLNVGAKGARVANLCNHDFFDQGTNPECAQAQTFILQGYINLLEKLAYIQWKHKRIGKPLGVPSRHCGWIA